MEVVRTFWIYAFVDNKVFAVFLMSQRVIAVRAFEGVGLWKTVFFRRECGGAYFAQDLSFWTIILVEIRLWSIATWTATVVINITFRTAADRFDFLAILPFEVRNVVFVIPFFVIDYFWELINLEFLIFGRMGIIEDPLLKGNISADKIKKPADLFMLVLNK